MNLINKSLFLIIFCGLTLLQAELTTANVLAQIMTSVNAYGFWQGELKEFVSDAGDITGAITGNVLTANYYFSRYGVSNNYSARLEYTGNWEKIYKVNNASYYAETPSGDQYVKSLDELLSGTLCPGFETYLLSSLAVTTFNQMTTENLVITASCTVSLDYQTAVLTVKNAQLEKIAFYNAAQGLLRTLLLEYTQENGLLYLKRSAFVYSGITKLTIREFTAVGSGPIDNAMYAVVPAGPIVDDTPPVDPDPWLPGEQAKYEEGGKLTPFAAYGVSGEEVPGQSGALQLGYTDLVLPGRNGLNVTIHRSYLSQQFRANPKPTSFAEDPFNVRYSARKFLDEYDLVMPDSWGGWMGKGWQTSIGGELYVNEINTFMMSGPYLGPTEVSQVKTMTVRNYTMQTADGYRADFGTEFEDGLKGSAAMGAIAQVSIAALGIGNICMARNNGVMSAEKMFEMRRYLEQQGKLETAPTVLRSKDKREKMKIKILNNDHYVVYLPDGKKYHFTQKIFNKEAQWYKDAYVTSIMGVSRGFLGFQYRSRIYYLTKMEDVEGNSIEIKYEPLFSEQSANDGYKAMDYNAKVDTQKFVQTALQLYSAVPEGETIDAAAFAVSMNSAISALSSAYSLSQIAFDKDARENLNMSEFAANSLIEALMDVIIVGISMIIAAIPPGPAGLFMREILSALIAIMFSISTDDATLAYKAKYEVAGWRPYKIVDTLNRDINISYRGPNDPNTLRDSQISKIAYKGPNGENNEIVYTYNGNDLLTRVDYPAGNPITYEYEYKDAQLNDKDIPDKGWLLKAVNHPSGMRSEYTYKWFQPDRDATTVVQPSAQENKRWSYYYVIKNTRTGAGAETRETKYEYRDGSAYSLYPEGDNSVSRRWYFKRHKLIDPLALETRKDYILGMLEAVHYPTLNVGTPWQTHHRVFNEYDLKGKTYLLKHQMVFKNTSMQEKFFEHDEYGQLTKITDMGFYKETEPLDQQITYINYEDALHAPEESANIYGLIREQYLEEPSRNPGVKYQRVQREYDPKGRLTAEHKYYEAESFITDTYSYDMYGNLVSHLDPRGVHTDYTYQDNAYLQTETKVVDGKTFRTEKTYSPWTGALFSSQDENNYLVTYGYDKLGRKTKETHPDGTFSQINYLDSQQRTELIDRKGRKVNYVYDSYGDLRTITDPLNNTTTYVRDRLGRLKTVTLADNRQYLYTYDELGRPIQLTYPDGTFSRKAYEDGNNSILVWDENGHGMQYHYSAQGDLLKVVRGDIQEAGTIHYEYEVHALKKIITPLDHELNFQNDLWGRRKSKAQPNGNTEYFQYDENSNLIKHTNYDSKLIGFVYDGLNRLTEENYTDTQNVYDVTYTYDQGGTAAHALGRLTLVADRSGTTQFKYNALGLITEETKVLDGISYTTIYTYDNTGLLTAIEYPQIKGKSIKVIYVYDILDRLDLVKLQLAAGIEQQLVDNTYDNVGRLIKKEYGNGLKESYVYDSKDRLIEQDVRNSSNIVVFNYKYKYDQAGNILQRDITDTNVLRRRDTYEYDYINQLKKVDLPGNKDLNFEYDRHFNRNFMTHGFGLITYNYDLAMNYLTEYKEDTDGNGVYELAVQYDYSKQGNPLYKAYKDVGRSNKEIARETYIWNDRDELTGITGRVTESYRYDYRGLRNIKNTNGALYKYIYMQNSQPAIKLDVAKDSADIFVYAGNERMQRIKIDAGGNICQEYFINDYQNSPILVAGVEGNILWQNYNDPWGNTEMSIGVPSANTEFKYTDKEQDEDSGLYYFQARYYDPVVGRFLGRDKLSIESKPLQYLQMNPYQFCNNNPIRNIDQDGLETMYVKGIGDDFRMAYDSGVDAYHADNMQPSYGAPILLGGVFSDALSVFSFNFISPGAQLKGYNYIASNYNFAKQEGELNNVVTHSGGGAAAFLPTFFANILGKKVDNYVTNASPMFGTQWILRLQGTNVVNHYYHGDPVSYFAAGLDVITFNWDVFDRDNWEGDFWRIMSNPKEAHSIEANPALIKKTLKITGDGK